MARTIAVCNQKGGVGKTTSAVNLASELALGKVRVLLVDLDPQANATGGLGIDKRKIEKSIYPVLLEEIPLQADILKTQIADLDLVPSQVSLSGAEVEMIGLPARETLLKRALDPVRAEYDLILIDAPPSLGMLTVNALTAADGVLIPLQCEYYALEGLSQLLEAIRMVQGALNPGLVIEGILLTMADFRTRLTSDVIEEARKFFGSKVYDVVIPRSVRLSEAPSHGLPICLYDPSSPGAQAYRQLAKTIKERIHVGDARIGERDSSVDSGEQSADPAGDPENPPAVHPSESLPAAESAQ
jgi:chromosome partitioning protein